MSNDKEIYKLVKNEAERIAYELRDECDGTYVGSETTKTIIVDGKNAELFVVAFWESSFWFNFSTTVNGIVIKGTVD